MLLSIFIWISTHGWVVVDWMIYSIWPKCFHYNNLLILELQCVTWQRVFKNPGSNCYILLIDPAFIPISVKHILLVLILNLTKTKSKTIHSKLPSKPFKIDFSIIIIVAGIWKWQVTRTKCNRRKAHRNFWNETTQNICDFSEVTIRSLWEIILN